MLHKQTIDLLPRHQSLDNNLTNEMTLKCDARNPMGSRYMQFLKALLDVLFPVKSNFDNIWKPALA